MTLDGRTPEIDAHGMRGRTRVSREESTTWSEHLGLVAVVGDRFLTVLTFAAPDGALAS